MTEGTFIYIECDYCKIGGYDFCPKCFGGGGYSVPESNAKFSPDLILKDNQTRISEKLGLIESSNTRYNEKMEHYLNKVIISLTSQSPTEEITQLINQVIRIKAKKETKYWVEKFKDQFRLFDLDIFKIVFTKENISIERRTLSNSSADYLIFYFSAEKEIFNDDNELLNSLPQLLEKSIFRIQYGKNDMQDKSLIEVIRNSNCDQILAFEITTPPGNLFFIIEVI